MWRKWSAIITTVFVCLVFGLQVAAASTTKASSKTKYTTNAKTNVRRKQGMFIFYSDTIHFLRKHTKILLPIPNEDELRNILNKNVVYFVKMVNKRHFNVLFDLNKECLGSPSCSVGSIAGEKTRHSIDSLTKYAKTRKVRINRRINGVIKFQQSVYKNKTIVHEMMWKICGVVYMLKLKGESLDVYQKMAKTLLLKIPTRRCTVNTMKTDIPQVP